MPTYQKKRHQNETYSANTLLWTSQLPYCEKLCFISHSIYGICFHSLSRLKPSHLNQTDYTLILRINMEDRKLVERKIHFFLSQRRYVLQWLKRNHYLLYLTNTLFPTTILSLWFIFMISICPKKKKSVNDIFIFSKYSKNN